MALSGAQKHDIIRLYDIPGDRIEVVGAGYNEALFRPQRKSARTRSNWSMPAS